MSYKHYQNKQDNDKKSDLLDDLYSRLAERDTNSDPDLTQTIKSMSKRWLQEAYIDGMMLADKLNRVTSSAKQNLDNFHQKTSEFEYSKPENSSNPSDQVAQMIQIEVQNQLQKLGFSNSKEQAVAKPQNALASFMFGMILLLSGFFIIGGAVGYYGLDSKVANVASQAYSSITASQRPQNNLVDQNRLAQNQAASLNTETNLKRAAAPELAASQNLINPSPTPESDAPALTLSNGAVAANAQNLTADTASQSPVNPAQNSTKVLPTSCNGQEPVLNRPLNIQNPGDRALLYCILDLQVQNQAVQNSQNAMSQAAPIQSPLNQPQTMPSQGFGTESQSAPNQGFGSQTPNPNQIPQR